MAWKALVPPWPGVVAKTGWCLEYAQSFFGAPVNHRSAWHAWLATRFKQGPDVPIPDVPVLLWYSHVGPYDDGLGWYDGVEPGQPANWGHVTPIIPGQGIYSSPASGINGASFDVYETIRDLEKTFNATYVGWSLDINGLLVATWEEEDDMYSDEDRKRDTQVAKDFAEIKEATAKIAAVYDALFKKTPTSRGSSAGVLKVLGKLEGLVQATYDASFKTDETSRGTPGDLLMNDRIMLELLEAIAEASGVAPEAIAAALKADPAASDVDPGGSSEIRE